jgi:hypothetical protein
MQISNFDPDRRRLLGRGLRTPRSAIRRDPGADFTLSRMGLAYMSATNSAPS